MVFSYETVFVNCDNYYDYNGDSGIYAGIYVGGYPIFKDVAKVSFTDCDNYGDVVATYAGLFYGNMQNTGLSVTIENCANNGNILGTKTAGALNNTMTNYDEYFAEQIKNLSGTDNIRVITDDTLAITEENGVLVIHQASNQNADKYSITFSAWPGIFDENGEQVGTSRTIIEIEIDNIAFESGKYVSDYVVYTMYDLNSYQALGKDVSNLQWVDYKENLRYAIVDGYLVVDYSNSLVTGDIVMNGIVAKVSVSVYGDESLLATADKA